MNEAAVFMSTVVAILLSIICLPVLFEAETPKGKLFGRVGSILAFIHFLPGLFTLWTRLLFG